MAMIQCKECGAQVSTKADKCPQCGAPPKKNLSAGQVILVLGGVLVMGMCGAAAMSSGSGGADGASLNPVEQVIDNAAENEMAKIHNKVATDAVAQYEMVKKSGDKIQTCVHAGMVEAAYIQAKDEPNFQTWNAIKKADCTAAGMP